MFLYLTHAAIDFFAQKIFFFAQILYCDTSVKNK